MRHRALKRAISIGFGLALVSPVWGDQERVTAVQSAAMATPVWALDQYQQARATEDPVARRLLLEHLFQALPETDLLWLRVKGQLFVIHRLEGRV